MSDEIDLEEVGDYIALDRASRWVTCQATDVHSEREAIARAASALSVTEAPACGPFLPSAVSIDGAVRRGGTHDLRRGIRRW